MLRLASVSVVALVCAMGVVACGGDDDASSTSGVPPGVMSALDGFNDAINAYDTEALLAHTTEDLTWQSTGDVTSRPDFVTYFEEYYEDLGFHSEITGEQVIERDGDAYVMTAPDHITARNFDQEGESVIRVVEIDGTWLVQELRWHASSPETVGCPPEGCEFEVTSDLTFADEALVDVYSPIQEGPWPVVVFVHGMWGSKADQSPGRGFATEGAVAYIVEVTDEPPFLATIEQVACAVRYARATGADYGGDSSTVTLVGFSMGAATGAVVGLSGDDHTAGCVEADMSAVPDAFVGYEGPYDWAHSENIGINPDLTLLEDQNPQLWATIDPYAHVGENPDLIVRLIQGVDDDTAWYDVQPNVAEDFHQALLDAGYDTELTLIEGASHSLGVAGVEQFDEIVAQTMAIAHTSDG